MKDKKSEEPFIDFDLSLNETMRQVFGEPIIDTDLTLEQTFDKFFEELPAYRQQMKERDDLTKMSK